MTSRSVSRVSLRHLPATGEARATQPRHGATGHPWSLRRPSRAHRAALLTETDRAVGRPTSTNVRQAPPWGMAGARPSQRDGRCHVPLGRGSQRFSVTRPLEHRNIVGRRRRGVGSHHHVLTQPPWQGTELRRSVAPCRRDRPVGIVGAGGVGARHARTLAGFHDVQIVGSCAPVLAPPRHSLDSRRAGPPRLHRSPRRRTGRRLARTARRRPTSRC